MNFELISSCKVRYCPSVIDSVGDLSYIVGCYQLIGEDYNGDLTDDQLTAINRRLGCLIYVESSAVKFDFECPDGGVFDLVVVPLDESDTIAGRCWAAHSNGTIACYDLTCGTIKLNKRILSGSSMLCSLAICDSERDLLIVGDSDSKILAIGPDKVRGCCQLDSLSDDPVWCLKSMKHDLDTFIVLSGSEDCYLRINLLQSGSFTSPIKKIKDFNAGVTSITIIDNPSDPNDDQQEKFDYVLYVGSYDEIIRVYYLKLNLGERIAGEKMAFNQDSIQLLPIGKIHINGSGIWKLKTIKSDQRWPYILTASMYAGAHVVQKVSTLSTLTINDNPVDLGDDESISNDQPNHLVYGVAGINNCKQIIISSFYNKSFHLFKRIT